MTQFLPPNLLALFAARDPIPYLPPAAKLPHEKKQKGYDGVGSFLAAFEHPSETPPPTRVETREERIERRRRERAEQVAYKLEQEIALWDPATNPRATTDPFKTLFVARVIATGYLDADEKAAQAQIVLECAGIATQRAEILGKPRALLKACERPKRLLEEAGLAGIVSNPNMHKGPNNYDTSESKLRREFEGYGTIKKIHMVFNTENDKPRGYAFIEYEHERDMHSAYKHADGKKIDGKRVLVDVERARTVKGWLPRRLGGGLGGTRRGGADVNIKHSGREDNERERERYRLEQRDRDATARHDRDRVDRGGGGAARRRSRSRSRRRSASRTRRRERERADRPRDEENEGSRRRRRSRSRSERRRERRDRDKERERDRDKKRSRRDKERKEPKVKPEDIKIKQEPMDDYPEFSLPPLDVQIKQEPADDTKYNPEEPNGDHFDY